MVYKRFAEVGRVALINSGPLEGKLCVLVDFVDQRRVLVDGPLSGVSRQALNFNVLSLTDLKIPLPPRARTGIVRKRFEKAEVIAKWEKTAWAQSLQRRTIRRSLTDFDRFKLKIAKQQKSRIVRTAMKKIKKEQK